MLVPERAGRSRLGQPVPVNHDDDSEGGPLMATQEQIETFIGTITAHRDGLMVLYTSVEELEAIVANKQFIRDLTR